MKSNREEHKRQTLVTAINDGQVAYENYQVGDYEALSTICIAIHLMSESTSISKWPEKMKCYFTGERFTRFPCLILAEQDLNGDLHDCTSISKKDVVLFFRAHLEHGSDSHRSLRSELARKKMHFLERYADEDVSVALVFADGLDFVETPLISLGPGAQSAGYLSSTGHPDSGYSPYVHSLTFKDREIKLGTLEAVTLSILREVSDVMTGKDTNLRKVILDPDWFDLPKWQGKLSNETRSLLSKLMMHYSKKKLR